MSRTVYPLILVSDDFVYDLIKSLNGKKCSFSWAKDSNTLLIEEDDVVNTHHNGDKAKTTNLGADLAISDASVVGFGANETGSKRGSKNLSQKNVAPSEDGGSRKGLCLMKGCKNEKYGHADYCSEHCGITALQGKGLCKDFRKNHRYVPTTYEYTILNKKEKSYPYCLECGKQEFEEVEDG